MSYCKACWVCKTDLCGIALCNGRNDGISSTTHCNSAQLVHKVLELETTTDTTVQISGGTVTIGTGGNERSGTAQAFSSSKFATPKDPGLNHQFESRHQGCLILHVTAITARGGHKLYVWLTADQSTLIGSILHCTAIEPPHAEHPNLGWQLVVAHRNCITAYCTGGTTEMAHPILVHCHSLQLQCKAMVTPKDYMLQHVVSTGTTMAWHCSSQMV